MTHVLIDQINSQSLTSKPVNNSKWEVDAYSH
jgi:hypothetical protein